MKISTFICSLPSMYCFFFSSLVLLVWLGQRDGETGEMGELESSSSEGEEREAMERERGSSGTRSIGQPVR